MHILHVVIQKQGAVIMARQSKEMKALKERVRYWKRKGYGESTYVQDVERRLREGIPFNVHNALRLKGKDKKDLELNTLIERNKEYIYEQRVTGDFALSNKMSTDDMFGEDKRDYWIDLLKSYEKNSHNLVGEYEKYIKEGK